MSVEIYLKDSYAESEIMVVYIFNNQNYHQKSGIDLLQEMLDKMGKLNDGDFEECFCPRITIEAYIPNEEVDKNTLQGIPNFKVDDSGTFIDSEKYHCEAHYNVNDPHDEETNAFITLKKNSIHFSVHGLYSGRAALYADLTKDEFQQLIHEYATLCEISPENVMSM